jgi:hypothetical protein
MIFITAWGNPFGVHALVSANNQGFHPWLFKENHFVVKIN